MKLWTYHPSTFRLDDPEARIDPTKGLYWNDTTTRYRDVLPRLQVLLGTDQFLWCCTTKGCFIRPSKEIDLVEWELDVPPSEILAFYSVPVWEDIVHGRSEAWDNLVIKNVQAANKDVDAFVRFPLKAGTLKCLGPLPIRHTRVPDP